MGRSYDLIVIGGGPAGLSAGIYAARARLNTLLIEKGLPGGQIVNAEIVENYPGFPEGISGAELGSLMEKQALRYDVEIKMADVQEIALRGDEKLVTTTEDNYSARAVIVASGSEHGHLGVPGEDELRGKGVSYCATCDGAFFREKVVAVVGGGDVALNDALFLTRFASRVIVIHRRDQLRGTRILQERAFTRPEIEFIWDTVVDAIDGGDTVKALQLRNVKTEDKSNLQVGGVFMAVGTKPNTEYLAGLLKLGPNGTIPVNNQMETEIPGVFAAGDIREGSIRQVVAAAGDGAIAAMAAERFITQA